MANVSKLKIGDTSYDVCDATAREDIANILNIVNPIGKIIHCADCDTEAKVIAKYGGNAWTQIEGRVIIGADSTYTEGSTGGSESHTHTANHNHNLSSNGYAKIYAGHLLNTLAILNDKKSVSQYSGTLSTASGTGGSDSSTSVCDSGATLGGTTDTKNVTTSSGSNLMPYQAEYIWKRIS